MTGSEHYDLAETRLAESERAYAAHDLTAAMIAAHQAATHATLAEVATRMPRMRIAAVDELSTG